MFNWCVAHFSLSVFWLDWNPTAVRNLSLSFVRVTETAVQDDTCGWVRVLHPVTVQLWSCVYLWKHKIWEWVLASWAYYYYCRALQQCNYEDKLEANWINVPQKLSNNPMKAPAFPNKNKNYTVILNGYIVLCTWVFRFGKEYWQFPSEYGNIYQTLADCPRTG